MVKQSEDTQQKKDDIEAKRISLPVAAIYYDQIESPYITIMIERGLFIVFLIWSAMTFLQFIHFDWNNFGSAMFSSAIFLPFVWLPLLLLSFLLGKILRKHNLKRYIREYNNAEGIEYLIEYHNKEVKYKWQKISEKEIRKLYAN